MKSKEEMYKIAEEIHERDALPRSYLARNFPRYDEEKRKHFLNSHNEIDHRKVCKDLEQEGSKFLLVRSIISLGLNEEETRKTIEARFDNFYGPENYFFKEHPGTNLEVAKESYLEWCNYFKIASNPNFPEWENKRK